ncbi:beta-ketoacyl synthase N-terminal-like domain-containing protein [Kitasatospora sp. NPDC056138]|uniref:beta-ketoacyl synthase N-terminal-like domain-containing protein n=1 Tax=Kitasatospora sp. NPDC056138 TaxID=3345724 RepID=UPI0035DEB6C7
MSGRPPAPAGITGLGIVCSVAQDVDGFADALAAGADGLRPTGTADGPALTAPVDGFSLERAVAARHLPAHVLGTAVRAAGRSPWPLRAAAAAALEAWEAASLHEAPADPDRIGLVVAGNNLTEQHTEQQRPRYRRDPAFLPARYALHHQDTDHVGTLSHILGITGEGCTVGGGSASGNLGVITGARLVELGAVDVCLVVGALVDLSPLQTRGYLTLGAMAAVGPPGTPPPGAPFDADHRGFSPGQAAAVVVLESAASARARGRAASAVLRGYGSALDGNQLADPSAAGEARAMRTALRRAGLAPREIGYVNTHGTASPLGDRTELAALRLALGDEAGTPWINSTKAVTGHCLASAGVVETVATVLQLERGFVHPTPGLRRPIDPGYRFAGTAAEGARPGFALSNGFGFGGFNTSLLLARPDA